MDIRSTLKALNTIKRKLLWTILFSFFFWKNNTRHFILTMHLADDFLQNAILFSLKDNKKLRLLSAITILLNAFRLLKAVHHPLIDVKLYFLYWTFISIVFNHELLICKKDKWPESNWVTFNPFRVEQICSRRHSKTNLFFNFSEKIRLFTWIVC